MAYILYTYIPNCILFIKKNEQEDHAQESDNLWTLVMFSALLMQYFALQYWNNVKIRFQNQLCSNLESWVGLGIILFFNCFFV